MKEFNIASLILQAIILEKKPFNEAFRSTIEKENVGREIQPLIRTLVTCELHHHLYLDYVSNHYFPSLSPEHKITFQTYLANQIYLKRIPKEVVQQLMSTFLAENNLDEQAIATFLVDLDTKQNLIDSSIKIDSPFYLSLRYNVPSWLIKMWQRHFGIGNSYKILRSLNRPVRQACRVNTLKTTRDEILAQDNRFVAGPIVNTVIYTGSEPLRWTNAYKNSLVLQQRMAATDSIFRADLSNKLAEILIVEARPNALYIELAIATNNENKINVGTNNIERKRDIIKNLEPFGLKKVFVFESTPKILISHVSNPQDYVICLPNCSKFDLIRSLPDFFIQFDQNNLDGLIAEQLDMITEASRFVVEGGRLIYSVNTLNKKESRGVINTFLKEHPEFVFIDDKQYFPFDDYNSAVYVANLSRGGEAASESQSNNPVFDEPLEE